MGKAGPFYPRPKVSKVTQRRLAGSSTLGSDGSRDSHAVRWSMGTEAGARATFSEEAQMRVGKQL